MTALAEVAAAGGRIWVAGDRLRFKLPRGRDDLLDALRIEKPRLLPMLRACEALCRETGADALALAAEIEAAYARLRAELAGHPEIRFAIESLPDDGGPYRLLAVAVRNAGFACLRIPRERHDEGELLELVHRIGATP